MRVVHLSLTDVRNYRSAEVPLQPGPNLIVGRNGQGKTNLVESIAYFATLRSHRVTSDTALIRAGIDAAVARMRVEASGREVLLELQVNRDRPNRAQVNRSAARVRELPRWFSAVVFAPEDLSIARGEPAGRRRFLDEALVASNPLAAGMLSDYERVVKQRTSLLKSGRASGAGASIESTLEVWDEQLITLGSEIIAARRGLVHDLLDPLSVAYQTLVEQDHGPSLTLSESVRSVTEKAGVSRETLHASSEPDVSRETIAAEFREALQLVRAQEIERAVTLVGPHRDDVLLELNGLPVKGYASHGESWSFVLALRLALASRIRAQSPGGDPVIILDDVFAELDMGRRARLMRAVHEFEQVIVTAAVQEDIPSDVPWHRVIVDAGTIIETGSTEARP